jgi:hypothetical protein
MKAPTAKRMLGDMRAATVASKSEPATARLRAVTLDLLCEAGERIRPPSPSMDTAVLRRSHLCCSKAQLGKLVWLALSFSRWQNDRSVDRGDEP